MPRLKGKKAVAKKKKIVTVDDDPVLRRKADKILASLPKGAIIKFNFPRKRKKKEADSKLPKGAVMNARGNGFFLKEKLNCEGAVKYGVYFHSEIEGMNHYKFLI